MRRAVQIEPMVEADVPAVAVLGSPSSSLTDAQLRDELARTWSREWVAREPGVGIVGFLLAWHVVDEVHILNVTTRADRRRRGIGRALMDTLIHYCREHRAARALLEVRRSNDAAISLYRTIGFYAVTMRARYYPDDEDAIEMHLVFDPATGATIVHNDEIPLMSGS